MMPQKPKVTPWGCVILVILLSIWFAVVQSLVSYALKKLFQ
jgi:hypothetical protein